ncbi:insulinase family protein [Pseudanabaena sp. FACHB-1998]|uniref:M16 family metallopeptidase n=1 Tax=Pseudanabaena sp. FACHB-1998 TaxID=2692858 RepID=UPI001680BF3F|nr:pitrilysin family protein [Pseudanabaena sp. FACHB-1998]MBD2176197.1 insulinase family protein [Pseudanabaena sp. FACHB-1998]
MSKRASDRLVLSNGIVVLVTENPTADIIAARCFFAGGERLETPAKSGLSHLAASLMTRGTKQYSSLEIAEQVESIGASLGTECSSDYFLLSLKTITADFHDVLVLGSEILRSPSFPDSELDLERRLTMQSIRSQQERPFTIAYDRLQKLMYGDHPYGLSSLGTEETVKGITRDDLVAFHQQQLRPEQMVVSIAGKISPEKAISLVEESFGDWQSSVPLSTQPTPTPIFQPQLVTHEQDTQQAIVIIGYPAPSVSSPDYAALKIISTYLGNGLSSRLFVELREKRGLAYEVSAFYPTRLETSQFVAYMGTASQNTGTALEGLRHECERLANVTLSEEELSVCKSKLLGQYALGKQTNSQIAQVYGWYEVMGLGLEFDRSFVESIEAVTQADVQNVAKKYFATPAISVVGSAEALKQLKF